MPKWLKLFIGVLLLPFCVGAVRALVRVMAATGQAELIWVTLASGAACWLVIFLMLPKPMRVYVVGHELTHVLWTWLFGGKVKRFRVSAKGGHVVVTKTNFLIVLSPYFFPIYAVAVVGIFSVGHLLWGWGAYLIWLHFVLGAAYSFHLTLTWHILQTRQSDITSQGYVFSGVVILLGNILVLMLGIPLLTARVSLLTALGWWVRESGDVLLRLRDLF